ncbi:MAG: metalloregulator ArsR/SmtB family transcription factor [Anaerolineae bacterium]
MGQEEFQTLLEFFKGLANESRLKMLGILANRECSVEELAALLNLKEPTVSHHLAKLKALSLVQMETEGNTHLYRLDTGGLQTMRKGMFTPAQMASLAEDVPYGAWERKVLNTFFEGEHLKAIPVSHKKRLVVLGWFLEKFERGVEYPEKAVNEVILRHHPDSATIRREFIMRGMMARENGVYWRLD